MDDLDQKILDLNSDEARREKRNLLKLDGYLRSKTDDTTIENQHPKPL